MLDQLISKLQPSDIIPVVAMAMVFGTALIGVIAAVIAGTVHRFREQQLRADLIRELVERGLSADEIERLVRATGKRMPADWVKDFLDRRSGQHSSPESLP